MVRDVADSIGNQFKFFTVLNPEVVKGEANHKSKDPRLAYDVLLKQVRRKLGRRFVKVPSCRTGPTRIDLDIFNSHQTSAIGIRVHMTRFQDPLDQTRELLRATDHRIRESSKHEWEITEIVNFTWETIHQSQKIIRRSDELIKNFWEVGRQVNGTDG